MTTVILGGTFNNLHIGHKALIRRAFELGDLVLIGLSSDKMANSSRTGDVRKFRERKKYLTKFIKSQNFDVKYSIFPISDKYGITLEQDFDILVVSEETLPTAKEINRLREEKDMAKVDIRVVDYIQGEDALPVSATRISRGEITPQGKIRTHFKETEMSGELVNILSKNAGKKPLLVHTCCALCAAYPLPLFSREFLPIGFFYNNNIQPFLEYEKRFEALKEFSAKKKFRVIFRDNYDPKKFMANAVKMGMKKGERCIYCYQERLRKTAKTAKRLGIEHFTTTLLSSPYQKHELVKKMGKAIASEFDLKFYYYDIREHYHEGVREVKKMGLYSQKYCGCLFSERDRFHRKLI